MNVRLTFQQLLDVVNKDSPNYSMLYSVAPLIGSSFGSYMGCRLICLDSDNFLIFRRCDYCGGSSIERNLSCKQCNGPLNTQGQSVENIDEIEALLFERK